MTGEVYSIPVHKQPLYAKFSKLNLPVCDKIYNTHLCPPLYPELEVEEIDYICEILIKVSTSKSNDKLYKSFK